MILTVRTGFSSGPALARSEPMRNVPDGISTNTMPVRLSWTRLTQPPSPVAVVSAVKPAGVRALAAVAPGAVPRTESAARNPMYSLRLPVFAGVRFDARK